MCEKLLLKVLKNRLIALAKVMLQQFVGKVSKFITFWCQASSGCCLSKLLW